MKQATWAGLFFLFSFSSAPATADKEASSLSKREQCIDEAYDSQGAREAEELGGRFGLEEYVVEVCGFRPVIETHRKISLTTEDCATVYSWSKDGLCDMADLSWPGSVILRALDPRAFDVGRFAKRCELNNARQRHEGFSTFRKHVCVSSVHDDAGKRPLQMRRHAAGSASVSQAGVHGPGV